MAKTGESEQGRGQQKQWELEVKPLKQWELEVKPLVEDSSEWLLPAPARVYLAELLWTLRGEYREGDHQLENKAQPISDRELQLLKRKYEHEFEASELRALEVGDTTDGRIFRLLYTISAERRLIEVWHFFIRERSKALSH